MTTIAYKDGVLAADTLITAGNERAGYAQKIGKISSDGGSVVYGACGNLAPCQVFMRWVASGMPEGKFDPTEVFSDDDGDASGEGFVVSAGNIVKFQKWGIVTYPVTKFACGSGGDYALGAMAGGLSAEDAVRAAIECDTASGGEVTVLTVEDFQSQDAT